MTAGSMPSQSQSRINPWLIRLPLLFLTGAFLTLLVWVVFLAAFQMRHMDRIVPGVSALGVDLGGMTPAEAQAALAGRFTYDSDAVFTFRYDDQIWQLSSGDLGVAFDLAETVDRAFQIGHSGNVARDLNRQMDAWFEGVAIAPVLTYDQNVAVAQLQTIAATINRAPVSAELSLNGTTVQVSEGQTGLQLDIPATLAALDAAILRMDTGGEITLAVNEIPPRVLSVAAAAQQIETALSAPLTLTATDENGLQLGPWTVDPAQIAALLRVTRVNHADGTATYEADIDMTAFESYLRTLAPGLITPALDGRFDFDPASGQLTLLEPAQSGRILNVPQTLARLEEAVFTETGRVVPMAFDYSLPRYHNQITAAELGIRELVAEATTYYTGSTANRRHNIAVGTSRMNGIIIGPGEEFSFNYYLGDISYENGFVDGLVIFGGRTVTGIGGGICQVSTTIFRAAFNSGLAITERNSHGYRVGYYELANQPPGMDAAIWQPERDFKFQNNTPHHLLIEATVYPGDNALQFRFYSTQHWQVELEDPIIKNIEPAPPPRYIANNDLQPGQSLQVDFAADGAEVTVYRNIYDMAGNLAFEDYAYTYYVPWQAIYEVAPGDSRLRQSG